MTSFEQMNRNRPDLCLVDVSQLSYEIIASYLTSRKNNEGQYLSKTSYSGIRSSIVYLFTMSNSQPPALFRERMQTLLKGLKRTIIAHAVNTGTSLEEGKDAMSFACYSLLCKKFFEGEKAEYIFAHLFLTLEWNLIARSDNVVNLSVRDLEWRDDSLIVYLKRSKTDQEGVNGRTPYHLYANPLSPHLCVVLSLSTYVLCSPGLLESDHQLLFPAQFQYNRYSKLLQRVISENEQEFERLGVKKESIGTHSARKGAATLAASGCTIAPSMSSICNRAGWKMGGTRDKYIKYESAGDQFLGRTLACLNSLTQEFSISPPFFHTLPDAQAEGIDTLLRSHIVGGSRCSSKLFELLRMCFASMIYHRQYMISTVSSKHKLLAHPLFNQLPVVSTSG